MFLGWSANVAVWSGNVAVLSPKVAAAKNDIFFGTCFFLHWFSHAFATLYSNHSVGRYGRNSAGILNLSHPRRYSKQSAKLASGSSDHSSFPNNSGRGVVRSTWATRRSGVKMGRLEGVTSPKQGCPLKFHECVILCTMTAVAVCTWTLQNQGAGSVHVDPSFCISGIIWITAFANVAVYVLSLMKGMINQVPTWKDTSILPYITVEQ